MSWPQHQGSRGTGDVLLLGEPGSAGWTPPAVEFPAWLDPSKAKHLWKAPWGAKACSAWQSDPANGCGSHEPHQSNCSSKAYPRICHPRREQTQNPTEPPDTAAGDGTPGSPILTLTGVRTPHRTPATTTATPPTRLPRARALSQLLFIHSGAFSPKNLPGGGSEHRISASLSAPCPVPSLFHAEPRAFPRDEPCPEESEGLTPGPPALPGGPAPSTVPLGVLPVARTRCRGGERIPAGWSRESSAATRSCRGTGGDRQDTGHGPGEATGTGDPQAGRRGGHSSDRGAEHGDTAWDTGSEQGHSLGTWPGAGEQGPGSQRGHRRPRGAQRGTA